jgi:hypothetical protein
MIIPMVYPRPALWATKLSIRCALPPSLPLQAAVRLAHEAWNDFLWVELFKE